MKSPRLSRPPRSPNPKPIQPFWDAMELWMESTKRTPEPETPTMPTDLLPILKRSKRFVVKSWKIRNRKLVLISNICTVSAVMSAGTFTHPFNVNACTKNILNASNHHSGRMSCRRWNCCHQDLEMGPEEWRGMPRSAFVTAVTAHSMRNPCLKKLTKG